MTSSEALNDLESDIELRELGLELELELELKLEELE
jgi:hypothetical protein